MHLLPNSVIQLWIVPFDTPDRDIEELRALLSADEREKVGRYRFEADRNCYIITRGILRQLIGQYIDLAPQDLLFEYNPHGKPLLPQSPLAFNVSHSGNFALLAFSATGSIGVDIELIRSNFTFSRLVPRYFSSDQITEIEQSQNPRATFFKLWTLKEAFIKAIGTGIFHDLNSLTIQLTTAHFTHPENHKRWSVNPLNIHPNYAAAVIHDTPNATIELRWI